MHVFVTGASGWIGSATVPELIAAGHAVTGLARSKESAARIEGFGARALLGDLADVDALRRGAAAADAVVHLGNRHDWADPEGNDRTERAAVSAMLDAVAGTGKALLVANGLSGIGDGRVVTEADVSPAVGPESDRGGSENLVLGAVDRGVRGLAVRFAPSVHGAGDWGFVAFLAAAAKRRGVSGYVGDGDTRWSAVHRGDAARLIRLGLEHAPAGTRLHAVAETAVPTRDIATALGTALGLPVGSVAPADVDDHFGFIGGFFATTMTATSDATRAMLDWRPTGPTLVDDILAGAYA